MVQCGVRRYADVSLASAFNTDLWVHSALCSFIQINLSVAKALWLLSTGLICVSSVFYY